MTNEALDEQSKSIAYTPTEYEGHYPPYLNIEIKRETARILVRGPAQGDMCGPLAEITVPLEELAALRTPEAKPEADEVERVARAIAEAEGAFGPLGYFPHGEAMRAGSWDDYDDDQHEEWRKLARAAIAALKQEAAPDAVGLLREALTDARLFVELVRIHWKNMGDQEQVDEAADCLARIDAALESGRE